MKLWPDRRAVSTVVRIAASLLKAHRARNPFVTFRLITDVVRYRERKLLMQPHDQIAGSPAHHAVDGGDWTLLYDANENSLVPGVELRGRTR